MVTSRQISEAKAVRPPFGGACRSGRALGAEGDSLLEVGVCLGERGCRAKVIEECVGLVENRRSLVWVAEGDKAAAVAEESVGVFGDDAELFPALGGVGVPVRGGLVITACFGEGSGGGDEGVVGVPSTGLVAGSEVAGDVEVIDRKCSSDDRGEQRGVLRVVAGVFGCSEFGEQCGGTCGVSQGGVGDGGGSQTKDQAFRVSGVAAGGLQPCQVVSRPAGVPRSA